MILAVILVAAVGCAPAAGPAATASERAAPASSAPAVSPSGSSRSADEQAAVIATVSTFEQQRAGGDPQVAYDLLAPRWQTAFGSVDRFRTQMRDYIGSGAREYRITGLSRDPSRVSQATVGDAWPDVQAAAEAGTAWVVDVRHPNVRGASAGSEVLLVAPDVTGRLRIWILH
jgi:hypothetical protein